MTAADQPLLAEADDQRVIEDRFCSARHGLHVANDRFLARFMIVQWVAAVILAALVSPQTWEGRTSAIHLHFWAAVFLGGAITAYPVWLGMHASGRPLTRHVIAVGQMLMSALLIHLTGGRIETHFHVFGSLVLLAFYRDVRVLLTATAIVYIDHLARGIFWPQSVYGVAYAPLWRAFEHAAWVLFEVVFLTMSVRLGLKEMRQLVGRQVVLERINRAKEQEVRDRTRDLGESEERFRSFFQDSPIGLYRANAAGDFEAVNPAMLALLGFHSLDEMHGSAVCPLSQLQDPQRERFLQELGQTARVVSRDTTWLRQDGQPVHVRESARAFRDGQGRIVRIDGAVEDVSERRALEERFQQAQKVQAIGQLAGGVAHDFNNILTAISGYSELLLQQTPGETPARRSAQHIRAASERAANLTHQLLAFSRKQRLQPRVLQLNAVVVEMDHMLQRLVGEHIRIRTISTPGLVAVRADPGQVQQVVMNLVVNARDAMKDGGQLTIETANVDLDPDYARKHPEVTPGHYTMLAVSDTGSGMTAEVKARLFEPFFTTKPQGSGTGLGLATCHGIVKQSGGHISVYSEVGRGTTFKVFLPAVSEVTTTIASTAKPVELRGDGQIILLVEDDSGVRDLGQEVLESLGYQVITAVNGHAALHEFERNPQIALIVTDVVMPDLGGPDLAKRVRARRPDVRVLFTSGYTFDALGEADLAGPNVSFLSKPYGREQLGASVRELLNIKAAGILTTDEC